MSSNHVTQNVVLAMVAFLAIASSAVAAEPKPADPAATTGIAQQAFCGIGVAPLSPVLTAQMPEVMKGGRGIVVADVVKDSPADKAGLWVHDIVLQYDGHDVYSPEQLVKLVRNDKPGREVVVSYVRAAKVVETKMTLAATPSTTDVRGSAGRLSDQDRNSARDEKPGRGAERRERDRQNNPQPWARFESMTLTRLDDGRFKAEIDFRDRDKKVLHRDYVGTREEIRKALESDKELPREEREHLLRTIDQQQPLFPLQVPRAWRDLFDLDSELFHWPSLSF